MKGIFWPGCRARATYPATMGGTRSCAAAGAGGVGGMVVVDVMASHVAWYLDASFGGGQRVIGGGCHVTRVAPAVASGVFLEGKCMHSVLFGFG